METGAIPFVEKIENFINGLIKLIKGFLALLGISFVDDGSDTSATA